MSEHDLLARYVERAARVTNMADLEAETGRAVQDLGVDYFAILHHVDLGAPGAEPAPGEVRFSNYPDLWREAIQERRLVRIDPVLAASQRTAHGFLWSAVPSLIDLNDKQKEVLSLASAAGLGDGYTVPVHVPGELFGSSSFCVRAGKPLPLGALPYLHYLGSCAFEAGRRIVTANLRASVAKLTERQLDCIMLAGRGLSARAAAKELGIKQDTFQKHIEEAKVRLGVRTTTELVVRCLFDGRIGYKDVLRSKRTTP